MNSVYHYFYFKLMYVRSKKKIYQVINDIGDNDTEEFERDTLSLSSARFMEKINKICDIKLSSNYSYKDKKTNNLLYLLEKNDENQCCLCGEYQRKHSHKNHIFIKKNIKYTCKNCGKYFYEHDHYTNPCFDPYVRL